MGEYLVHSKGKWKKHKYVRKEGDRYIYPDSDALASLTGARPGTAEKLVGHTKKSGTAEKLVGYTKRPSADKGGLSAGSRGNVATRVYNSARKEAGKAYRSGKKAVRDIGRKIDNTRIGTSVTTLRDNPNSKPYYRKETPYRVKDLRRGITKSAKAARKNATRSIKRGRNYIKKKLRR